LAGSFASGKSTPKVNVKTNMQALTR
jgi:hypothetical protein